MAAQSKNSSKPETVTPQEQLERKKEFLLCASDPIHFIKNYCKIPHQEHGEFLMGDSLYPKQEQFIRMMATERFVITNKTRQCGFSTAIGCFALWFALFHINKSIVVVSISDEHSKEFLARYVQYPYDQLPSWMKQKQVQVRGQYQNMHQLSLYTGSRIKCEAGKNAGRGGSNAIVVVDEVGFIEERVIKDMWSSVFPTISSSREAKVFLNSSSSIAGTWYHEKWEASLNDQSDFKKIEVDWNEVPWLLAQDDYLEMMRQELVPSTRFRREILREFIVDQGPFIPIEFIDRIVEEPPIRTDFLTRDNYIPPDKMSKVHLEMDQFDPEKGYIFGLLIWQEPIKGHKYFLAGDVAEGTNEDFSTIELLDLATCEQVGEYHGKIDTFTFADIIIKVALFYNHAFVAVEANAAGNSVVSRLEKTFKYENLYYRPLPKGLIAAGFRTHPTNRGLVLNAFYRAVVQHDYKIRSKRLKREMKSFVTEKGQTHAAQGTHDDLVMAYAIACFLIEQNVVQSAFYDIHVHRQIEDDEITEQNPEQIKRFLEQETEYEIDDSSVRQYRWMY